MKKELISIADFPKEEQELYYGFQKTDFGKVLIISTKVAFISLEFVETQEEEKKLLAYFPTVILSNAVTDNLWKRFVRKDPIKIYVRARKFQKSVWNELIKIPEGIQLSYQDIANRIGHPRAVRAVGNAVGSNPVSLVIPCHRVIRKNGQMGGYRWGVEKKMKILAKENKK